MHDGTITVAPNFPDKAVQLDLGSRVLPFLHSQPQTAASVLVLVRDLLIWEDAFRRRRSQAVSDTHNEHEEPTVCLTVQVLSFPCIFSVPTS